MTPDSATTSVVQAHEKMRRWYERHPKWRGPSTFLIVLWVATFVGFGVVRINDARTASAVARVHNISACSLGIYLVGARDRALATSVDQTVSDAVRKRAAGSIIDLNILIASQVTYPANYDCSRLIRQVAQGHAE